MKYVSCFLKDLSNNYQNIHTQILLHDSISNISRIYSLITQQEVTLPTHIVATPTIIYANNPSNIGCGRGKGHTKGSMLCTNCHKTNHMVETCYFKHGFPLDITSRTPNPIQNQAKHQFKKRWCNFEGRLSTHIPPYTTIKEIWS